MDMNGNDLPLLASLSVLLDECNVTRAAERLRISQPALSGQLARLRDVFGDQLLVPAASGRGMVLTARGVQLREPLRAALEQLRNVVDIRSRFDPKQSDRTFSIGASDNSSAMIAPKLFQSLRCNGVSRIRVAIRALEQARLVEHLETGQLDIAIVTKEALPNGLPHQPLMEARFMMAQRKGHPRGTRRPSLEEYVSLEHVIVAGEGTSDFRGFIDDILKTKGVRRRVSHSIQYFSVVPAILQESDFVCTLPARLISQHADMIVGHPLPFDPGRFFLYVTWHMRFDNDPAHTWLREQVASCARD